jgi:hypothetical protein
MPVKSPRTPLSRKVVMVLMLALCASLVGVVAPAPARALPPAPDTITETRANCRHWIRASTRVTLTVAHGEHGTRRPVRVHLAGQRLTRLRLDWYAVAPRGRQVRYARQDITVPRAVAWSSGWDAPTRRLPANQRGELRVEAWRDNTWIDAKRCATTLLF